MTPSESSYFHLAVGYFNIILPTLLPFSLSTSDLFWHRARSTKNQTQKAVKSSFAISRFRNTSKTRAERSIKWAKIDDSEAKLTKLHGLGFGGSVITEKEGIVSVPKIASISPIHGSPKPTPLLPSPELLENKALPPPSQKALMGVSMLGNLDGMYKHSSYPNLTLKTLTTGSRQRQGGLLLFAYTFT